MLAPNIVTRCWRKKSTNLWPSGVAPWKPDCRTGFLSQFSFPRFWFHHISEVQFDLSEKNLDYSGTNFDSFLLRIAPGFWDLVHQIAREKQYPGKKIQNISFSHFPDELSGARCLCWFSIVKPLWFLGASTGTHFDPLDNWFSTRGKKFPNAVGINPIGKKTFMSNHSAKAQKVQ